jgi:hypothetical protein
MKRRFWAALCAAVVAPALACSIAAAQPAPAYVSISVNERTDYDGTTSFYVFSSLISFAQRERTEILRSPLGIESTRSSRPIEYDVWEEVAAAVFGEWTFTSTAVGDPADVETYRFEISPFARNVFPDPPVISPPNLSVVTSPFRVNWDPPSSSYGWGAGGVPVSGKLIQPGEFEFKFTASLNDNAHLSFSTGAPSRSMNSSVSAVTAPDVDPLYALRASLSVGRSLEVRYIPADAVPEPASASLLGMVVPAGVALVRLRTRSHP